MLADRLPSNIGQSSTDVSRRSATGCSARSWNTGARLSTFHTRWLVSSCSSSSPNFCSRPRARSCAAAAYSSSCADCSWLPESTPVTAQIPSWRGRARRGRGRPSAPAEVASVLIGGHARAVVSTRPDRVERWMMARCAPCSTAPSDPVRSSSRCPTQSPAPGQVLLRVTAAGVCHSDEHIMALPAEAYVVRSAADARPRGCRRGGRPR